jgi:hemoglobin
LADDKAVSDRCRGSARRWLTRPPGGGAVNWEADVATSLFEKYGGFANVSKIVMAFYDAVLDSDLIGPFFDDVDMARLVDHQTKFIASVMGGPASYSDEMLRQVHAPHAIDRAAFDEMAAILRRTLVDFGVEAADVDTILGGIEARSASVIADK